MDDHPILGSGDGNRFLKQFLAQYDAPAYIRRARQVEEAFDNLVNHCRVQREKWLPLVRLRLGRLRALAGAWDVLRPWLGDHEQVLYLQSLEATLRPHLRVAVERTSSPRTLCQALRELRDSINHFNRRWQEFLPTVDLTRINELRAGYNRYYLLEKECAVRSARVARQGFRPLAPLTHEDLDALVPLLPVLHLRG